MNNFIEEVNMALKKARQREKQRKQKVKESLRRNEEDWKRIDLFLKNKVLECIEKGDGSSWIRIDNFLGELLVLKDENQESLVIHQLDIKRFCKQYGFKLMYIVQEGYREERKTFFFHKLNTRAYLIKVKHIL